MFVYRIVTKQQEYCLHKIMYMSRALQILLMRVCVGLPADNNTKYGINYYYYFI